MDHRLNYVSKDIVTYALLRKLLRQAEGIPPMGDTMCIENYVNKPIKNGNL